MTTDGTAGIREDVGARDSRFRPRLAEWIPEILFLSVTTVAGLAAAGRWVDPTGDPGTWWSIVDRLARGEILYRDVFIQFGPLSPYLLALGARFFGPSVAFLAIATWVSAIAASLLLLRAARRVLNAYERVALAGLLLAVSVFAPGAARLVFPYAPGAVHALAFSVAALGLIGSDRLSVSARAWTSGLLAGAALLAKQEIGVACIASLVVAGLAGPGLRWVVNSLAGFSLAGLLGAVVVLSSASLESLRGQSRVWPLALTVPEPWKVLYRSVAGLSNPDGLVVLRTCAWQVAGYVALFALIALALTREQRLTVWLPTALLFVAVILWKIVEGFPLGDPSRAISLSMLVAIVVAASGLAARGIAERPTLIAFGLFAALTASRTAFSSDPSGPYVGVARFASCLTWVVFLCRLVPWALLASERPRRWFRIIAASALLIVGATGTWRGIESLAGPAKEAVQTRQGVIFVSPGTASFFRSIARTVSPGQRVWVLPEIDGVDALFDARNASPYPSHAPGWLDERAEADLLKRIEPNRPDVVVVFTRPTTEYAVAPFGLGYDRSIAAWIARNYSAVETSEAGTILRPRHRD